MSIGMLQGIQGGKVCFFGGIFPHEEWEMDLLSWTQSSGWCGRMSLIGSEKASCMGYRVDLL